MKKVIEWLETIPNESTRNRAIKNYNLIPANKDSNKEADSLAKAIDMAFCWINTDEDEDFWASVVEWSKSVDQLTGSMLPVSRTEIKEAYLRCPIYEADLPDERIK